LAYTAEAYYGGTVSYYSGFPREQYVGSRQTVVICSEIVPVASHRYITIRRSEENDRQCLQGVEGPGGFE